jgi:serine/threonine protein kinase
MHLEPVKEPLMSSLPASHPDSRDLTAFAEGLLSTEEAARVAGHLQVCPQCCAVVEEKRGSGAGAVSALSETALPVTSASLTGTAFEVPPEIPAELANHPRYRIVRVLGQGGMGTVYLAEHRRMERLVALKVINRALLADADMLKRFFAEVKAASRLAHPNIVTAYDSDEAGTLYFLVTEYVEGISLAEYLKKIGPLPIRLACNLARQVAEGLQHAHQLGMVHRDVKPSNLMLTENGRVKILDFGLARLGTKAVPGEGLTRTGTYMGTPDYMSPEQARDASRADARADIYSLGATLYCLLTGRPPFIEATALDVMMAHVMNLPEPLPRLRSEVPEGLSVVVARMLAKEPAQRYQTAAQVKQALTPFARTEGPSAPPLPWPAGEDSVDSLRLPVTDTLQGEPAKPLPMTDTLQGEPAKPQAELQETLLEPGPRKPAGRWLVLVFALLALAPVTAFLLTGGPRTDKATESAPGKSSERAEQIKEGPPPVKPPEKELVEKGPEKPLPKDAGKQEEKRPPEELPMPQLEGTNEADRPGLPNTIGMTMVRIPGGTFRMGSPRNEEGRWDEE